MIPVVLFVYNRPEHTRKAIASLLMNKECSSSDLYIFSDGPKRESDQKAVEEVRRFIHSISGFKSVNIIEQEKNKGLAASVIAGVTSVFEHSDSVIVLEDDLIFTSDFLDYMNRGMQFYRDSPDVFSITGYSPRIEIPTDYPHDVYASYRISSWSWGTWKDRWEKVDWNLVDFPKFIRSRKEQDAFNESGVDSSQMLFDQVVGKVDSWAIRFHYGSFRNNGLNIYPVYSKITNTGIDGSGTHVKVVKEGFGKPLQEGFIRFENVSPDARIIQQLKYINRKSIIRKTINFFRRTWYLLKN